MLNVAFPRHATPATSKGRDNELPLDRNRGARGGSASRAPAQGSGKGGIWAGVQDAPNGSPQTGPPPINGKYS